jgi:hypothetical protein
MGGGDLNMKKSWHPLLQKNQEAVWQAENRAREERKRIEQKRKEIAEERQVLELQRLQESQGGVKVRQERLDWMYTAPSGAGHGPSESMEQYLLGKRKVDDLIMGDENEKLKKSADETAFMATQNANSVTDTRNKILNDPLLAIKKQEQRQFEELMKNPLKLREMKIKLEKMNGNGKVKKEDKEERRHKSHGHRHRHHSEERRSEKRHNDEDGDYRSDARHKDRDDRESRRHRDNDYRDEKRHRDRDDNRRSEKRYHDREDDYDRSSKSRRYDDDRRRPDFKYDYSRTRSPPIKRESRSPPQSSESDEAAKAAALAAMMANAEELESSRATRLAALEEKEKSDLQREEIERSRKKDLGGRAGFMRDMQGKIMEEGRRAMVR